MVVAAIVTIFALPFLWTSKREQPTAPGGQIAVVTADSGLTGSGKVDASDVAASTPAYLAGSAVSVVPAPIVIDIAPPGDVPDAVGSATFQQLSNSSNVDDKPCWVPLAPFGARVVITNTENGFKIDCQNIRTKPLPPEFVIVIDKDAFGALADLTEAPIPVELTWQ